MSEAGAGGFGCLAREEAVDFCICGMNYSGVLVGKAEEKMEEDEVGLDGFFRSVSQGAFGIIIEAFLSLLTKFNDDVVHEVVDDVNIRRVY